MSARELIAHLSDGRTSMVFIGDGGMPELAHWGAPLGGADIDPAIFERPVVGGGLDVDPPVGLVAESSRGWFGRPGIEGHRRDGRDFAPRFATTGVVATPHSLVVDLSDVAGQLSLHLDVGLADSGVVSIGATLTNDADEPFTLSGLRICLPVPAAAEELLTIGGSWAYEFDQHRSPWTRTCVTVENRRGKTSHERLGAVFAGTASFGEQSGEVWGCHIGWSGNYEIVCDASTDARKVLHAGELLLPGEVELAGGASYAAPTVYAVYSGAGLTAASVAYHRYLRARPQHPRSPRPIHLNTWEAVYFDHDLTTLKALADAAAEVGIERFVLDDGWFGGRRDDRRGLGDWWVSPEAWPDGLHPLIDHVRGLGMEFGIWVEPEMVNPDSDLYREHPEWALVDPRHEPVLGRSQLVLDLGRPEVRDRLFDQLDALLRDHDIAYLKWDHNRDLVAPASDGRAGVREQTLGVYELLDRLRLAHPGVDIETCASGGGRVDFGILERTDRVWVSDSIDALDRHRIQRGFSLLFPPELMGSHIGAGTTHTTRRRHRLGFRGVSALFGAFGVEWNLLHTSPAERAELAELIALHKHHRQLLHSGDAFRGDHPDPTIDVHGVVAGDGSEALVAVTRLASGPSLHAAPVRVRGLDDDRWYAVRRVEAVREPLGRSRGGGPTWLDGQVRMTGRQLRSVGVSAPQLFPESSLLIHLVAADADQSVTSPPS